MGSLVGNPEDHNLAPSQGMNSMRKNKEWQPPRWKLYSKTGREEKDYSKVDKEKKVIHAGEKEEMIQKAPAKDIASVGQLKKESEKVVTDTECKASEEKNKEKTKNSETEIPSKDD